MITAPYPHLKFLLSAAQEQPEKPALAQCEDAEPISIQLSNGESLIAVADGLGGYSEGYQNHSGGYWSSRIVIETLSNELKEGSLLNADIDFLSKVLTDTIGNKLKKIAAQNLSPPRLRGQLNKYRLASTLAGAIVFDAPMSCTSVRVRLFWMGDSRIYFLSEDGLHQLSYDDVREDIDAFAATVKDLPMSQFFAANMSADWQVHCYDVYLPSSGLLFACTDGCFSYWRYPWEFECALIDAMSASDNWDSWVLRVSHAVDQIKMDDASLVAMPLGRMQFADLKISLQADQMQRLCRRLNVIDRDRSAAEEVWMTEYKPIYERYYLRQIAGMHHKLGDERTKS